MLIEKMYSLCSKKISYTFIKKKIKNWGAMKEESTNTSPGLKFNKEKESEVKKVKIFGQNRKVTEGFIEGQIKF